MCDIFVKVWTVCKSCFQVVLMHKDKLWYYNYGNGSVQVSSIDLLCVAATEYTLMHYCSGSDVIRK